SQYRNCNRSATPHLPVRRPIPPALCVPTPTAADLTDARTPPAQRWAISRASQIAALPPHYDAQIAMALIPLSTRTAPLALSPSVILPLYPPPETTWTKKRMALLDIP